MISSPAKPYLLHLPATHGTCSPHPPDFLIAHLVRSAHAFCSPAPQPRRRAVFRDRSSRKDGSRPARATNWTSFQMFEWVSPPFWARGSQAAAVWWTDEFSQTVTLPTLRKWSQSRSSCPSVTALCWCGAILRVVSIPFESHSRRRTWVAQHHHVHGLSLRAHSIGQRSSLCMRPTAPTATVSAAAAPS